MKNKRRFQNGLGIAALSLGVLGGATFAAPGQSEAARWLAPAADEQLAADWVRDVARELDRERFRRVLMNAPIGRPQVTILEHLNDAAEAMGQQETRYAKDLIQRSLDVLDDGVEYGWMSRDEVRPIKDMIISKARTALRDAESGRHRGQSGRDQSRDRGSDTLYGHEQEMDAYGGEGDRWTGYTRGNRYGLTERLTPGGEGASRSRWSRDQQDQHDDERRFSDRRGGRGDEPARGDWMYRDERRTRTDRGDDGYSRDRQARSDRRSDERDYEVRGSEHSGGDYLLRDRDQRHRSNEERLYYDGERRRGDRG